MRHQLKELRGGERVLMKLITFLFLLSHFKNLFQKRDTDMKRIGGGGTCSDRFDSFFLCSFTILNNFSSKNETPTGKELEGGERVLMGLTLFFCFFFRKSLIFLRNETPTGKELEGGERVLMGLILLSRSSYTFHKSIISSQKRDTPKRKTLEGGNVF